MCKPNEPTIAFNVKKTLANLEHLISESNAYHRHMHQVYAIEYNRFGLMHLYFEEKRALLEMCMLLNETKTLDYNRERLNILETLQQFINKKNKITRDILQCINALLSTNGIL